ncbi:MAG: DUF6351 family protein, partial [Alteraurantiacibacter sp.]
MRSTVFATVALAALMATMPGCVTASATDTDTAPPVHADRCEGCAGELKDGWGMEEGTVRMVPAGPTEASPFAPPVDLPAHCLVEGTINPRAGVGGVSYGIGFQLALPLDWNGRYLLQGGGGLNGSVRPAIGPVAAGDSPALARGFAVVSHDSGHQGTGFDASFYTDQRAALDFAEASVREVAVMTRAFTQSFYGTAPHHSYMTGCSTGGREGMLASQRYPELFDGIV